MADLTPDIFRKVAAYLNELPAYVLVDLVHQIDRAMLTEDADPAQQMVRRSAADMLAAKGAWGPLVAEPQDLALSAIIPFRVDIETEVRHTGRIEAQYIRTIWRELLRDDTDDDTSLTHEVRRAARGIARDPTQLGDQLAELRKTLATRLAALQDRLSGHEPKSFAQIGGERAGENLADIVAISSLAEELDVFTAALDAEPALGERIDEAACTQLVEVLSGFGDDQIVYPLILLMNRLQAPGSLVYLLTHNRETDEPEKLGRGRFAVVGEVLLSELDVLACHARAMVGSWDVDALADKVHRFDDIAANFAAAVDLEHPSDWSRRLAASRAMIADALRDPVEQTPRLLRDGIRPGGAASVAPDPFDVERAIASAKLLNLVKPKRDELALNECVGRVCTAVEVFLDNAAKLLPEQARAADEATLTALKARFDALYRVSGVLFGEDYAAILRRSGEVAGLRVAAVDDSDAA